MSSEVRLGQHPGENAQRDAVHVAVFPCTAATTLQPGSRVTVTAGKAVLSHGNAVGVIDPFLDRAVKAGERVYVCLFPGSVVGMRHHWKHPHFDGDKAQSEEWLREYAANVNSHLSRDEAFDRLIQNLREESLSFYGSNLHTRSELPNEDELKHHAEIYLGTEIDFARFAFSCSC